MDMQNVSNLTIPEGEVKAIHNFNNQLLWGRVNYNTKYAGDTFQQTYSGKNLFNKDANTTKTSAYIDVSPLSTGVRVKQLTSSTSSDYIWALYIIGDTSDYVGKTLTLYTKISASSTNTPLVGIGLCNSNGSSVSGTVTSGTATTTISKTFTQTDADNKPKICLIFYATAGGAADANSYVDYTDVQLEVGSSATSYEPYTGGTASPNPDYPQDIDVVTGTQTVQITAGTESEDFTVSLGTIELCKIGNYQDHIYKSGDDWYVHKEIWDVVVNGSVGAYNSGSNWYYAGITALSIPTPVKNGRIISNYFTESTASYMGSSSHLQENGLCAINGNTHIIFRNTTYSSTSDYQTWLNSINPNFYYALATPTDTKITDSTLIGQLNAMHQWLTRYGYNATVSGNLPLIVDRTNL